MSNAKPFIKWVGGKSQLISQLDGLLPYDFRKWNDVTYIEPFIGGGAMLFYMLSTYPNIIRAVINDINPDLTTCYKTVRDAPDALLLALSEIQKEYDSLRNEEARSDFYYLMRERFNAKNLDPVQNTTLFFFLNRTCFNGLYRVNSKGGFNVPFGKYESPSIYSPEVIYADSELLQNVEILTGDFEQTFNWMRGKTLFYFDPPYRPLSNTSSFNNYSKEAFNDSAQIRLKKFCDRIHEAGGHFMLSNSDCKAKNASDTFFDELYLDYNVARVWASRSVNSNASKRGKLTELLVCNYGKPYNQEENTFKTQLELSL